MVEPLASVVYNTFLSGRSKITSVARSVAAPSPRHSLGQNFFTPEPRRVKGKAKVQNDPPISLDESLREWSSSSSRHIFFWPFHTHSVMLDELAEGEEPTALKKHKRPPKPRPRIARSVMLMQASYRDQRRHSSHTSEGSPGWRPSISKFSRHEQRVQRFQRVIQLPRAEVNLDHAFLTYNTANEYDLPLPSKMSFADKYISAAEMRYRRDTPLDRLHKYGECAQSILEGLEPAIAPNSRFDQWRLCLVARSCSLMGDFARAQDALHAADAVPLSYTLKAGIPYAYEMVITSIVRHEGNVPAMTFIGKEWGAISSYLDFKASAAHTEAQGRAGGSLRVTASRIAAEITDPNFFLEKEDWDKKRRENIGCFFIQSLSYAQLGIEGRDVLFKMQALQLRVPQDFQFMLVRSLARRTVTMNAAVELYKSIPHSERDLPYTQLGLHLYARQGDTAAFEERFSAIKEAAHPSPEDIASLIHGYAMADNAKRAEETFEEFFPFDEQGKRKNSPTLSHYSAVIYAHARKRDNNQAGITFWLTDLANADMVPNEHVFTIVLNAFAAAGDFKSTMAVLGQMRDAGVRPNVVTYTIVITLLAHRKDPMGAEAVFKRALKDGVIPDNRMIVAVMNAHVEGGSWQGVIRAYDYLMAARVTALSLEVYNTLMKAYVLIGAPFTVVYKFFKRLEQSKAKPDAHTYSLLVQSACDAGLMNIAADIYYDMEQLFRDNPDRNLDVNVYILTILMAGFLQHGDKIKAKAVYDEMLELGVHPSPITFGTILKAYGNERSKDSLEIAEVFIKSLVDVPEEERTWKRVKYDSNSALHHLYAPVIAGWARMKSPEDVERVFEDMEQAGVAPSLGTLTALMDVYRRTFNVDAVLEIWPQIEQLGLELTSKDWMTPEDDRPQDTRGIRGNILCVPLSIYIDALSAAGLHKEIAVIWKEMRTRGFSFDSHNWNHLAVALVRAGEVERAFEVIERVIIPYQELSIHSKKIRDRNPSSPLLSDVVPADGTDEKDEVPGLDALRSGQRHTAAKISKARTQQMEGFQPADDHGDDFAYHLHILHQIAPSWATWKAHHATLSVLLIAFNKLSEGRLVTPTGTNENEEDFDEIAERREARDILDRIYNKYPKTVRLVLDHDTRERQILLSEEYEEKYNWG